ncbi:hypothetical protein [Vandammella animalimorsus]|uniref:hypothetical protein n=1 Tax=Vandammella animalimorsus TaxID=2029117 RepID=UPI001EEDE8AC|nr:hypothetical protein [Vandammella animalimorsus]
MALVRTAHHVQEIGRPHIGHQVHRWADRWRKRCHILDQAKPIVIGQIDFDLRRNGSQIGIVAGQKPSCLHKGNETRQLVRRYSASLEGAGLPCRLIGRSGKQNILEVIEGIEPLVLWPAGRLQPITGGLSQQTPAFKRLFTAQQIKSQRARPAGIEDHGIV